jgi:glycosyl-4,4'-diaponeurosporenoate acyltransferase
VSTGTIVLCDALVWAAWSAVVGYTAHRLPSRQLGRDGRLTRLRAWERDGRLYERLAIRRWKDRLPEFGAVFPGGVSKRSLATRDTPALTRFAAETRRAEVVHWAIPLVTPLFALWNPAWLVAAMAAYALAANAPCLLIQRYNRGRLLRVLARRARRSGPAGHAEAA